MTWETGQLDKTQDLASSLDASRQRRLAGLPAQSSALAVLLLREAVSSTCCSHLVALVQKVAAAWPLFIWPDSYSEGTCTLSCQRGLSVGSYANALTAPMPLSGRAGRVAVAELVNRKEDDVACLRRPHDINPRPSTSPPPPPVSGPRRGRRRTRREGVCPADGWKRFPAAGSRRTGPSAPSSRTPLLTSNLEQHRPRASLQQRSLPALEGPLKKVPTSNELSRKKEQRPSTPPDASPSLSHPTEELRPVTPIPVNFRRSPRPEPIPSAPKDAYRRCSDQRRNPRFESLQSRRLLVRLVSLDRTSPPAFQPLPSSLSLSSQHAARRRLFSAL